MPRFSRAAAVVCFTCVVVAHVGLAVVGSNTVAALGSASPGSPAMKLGTRVRAARRVTLGDGLADALAASNPTSVSTASASAPSRAASPSQALSRLFERHPLRINTTAARDATPARRHFGAQQADDCVGVCTTACLDGCGSNAGCNAAVCRQACQQRCDSLGQSGAGSAATTSAPSGGGGACGNIEESAEAREMERQCGVLDFSAVMDFDNRTEAARQDVARFCATGCQAAYRHAIDTHRACIDDAAAEMVPVLLSLCTQHDGEYCAWQLRGIQRVTDCERQGSEGLCLRQNTRAPTGAPAATPATSQQQPIHFDATCRWHRTENTCEAELSPALLLQTCTPCLDRYVLLLSRVMSISAVEWSRSGQSASVSEAEYARQQRENIELAQRQLINSKNLLCAKVGATWCAPMVDAIDDRVFEFDGSHNMTIAAVNDTVATSCTRTGRRCLNKVMSLATAVAVDAATANYQRCLRESSSPEPCRSLITSPLQEASAAVETVGLLCARNEAGDSCGVKAHEFAGHACFDGIHAGSRGFLFRNEASCNATCARWFTEASEALGCCWERSRRVEYASRYPIVGGLPRDVARYYESIRPNATALRSFSVFTSSVYRHVQYCQTNASLNAFNATRTEVAVMAVCPETTSGPTAVRKQLPLRGVRWSEVQANATLRARLTAALSTDVARALGVPVSDIVNATLAADTSQQLTVNEDRSSSSNNPAAPSSASSASAGPSGGVRRQQDASSSAVSTPATVFDFAITGDDSTDVAESAAAFDAATRLTSSSAATGIDVTATAVVLAEDCSACIGSPTAAPGETAAPPPTGAIFAAAVGADTSGTNSPAPGQTPLTPPPAAAGGGGSAAQPAAAPPGATTSRSVNGWTVSAASGRGDGLLFAAASGVAIAAFAGGALLL